MLDLKYHSFDWLDIAAANENKDTQWPIQISNILFFLFLER